LEKIVYDEQQKQGVTNRERRRGVVTTTSELLSKYIEERQRRRMPKERNATQKCSSKREKERGIFENAIKALIDA